MGIEVIEEPVMLEDIHKAEEAFATNSLIEIAPVVEVDGVKVGDGMAGSLTREMQRGYRLVVKESLAEEQRHKR